MASGYGLHGGPSRCFPFWQELLACYVVNASDEKPEGAAKCIPAMEDYEECLHHRKEKARTAMMQYAYRKAEATNGREQPKIGQVRNLGVLGKDEDTKAVLGTMYGGKKS